MVDKEEAMMVVLTELEEFQKSKSPFKYQTNDSIK